MTESLNLLVVKKKRETGWIIHRVIRYVLLALVILFVIAPFYIMFATSIMTPYEAQGAYFKFWPENPSLAMYRRVLIEEAGGYSIIRGFLNTMLYYGPSSLIGVFVSAMSAFAFAKVRFPGKTLMFSVLIATMTIPNNIGLITSYLIFDKLGWIGTALPLFVPRLFGTIGVVFFLRQYYISMPDDLIGCAKIDGLGCFGTFMRIMLPTSVPVLVAQFILYFITGYNDYMGPLLYLPTAESATLQLVLAQYEDPYLQNWPLRMAGCFVAMLPLIALYLASQKFIMKDMSISSGFKG